MRRYAVLLIVLALVSSGCAAKAMAGRLAMQKEIDAGDRLLGEKRYDEAVERYLSAATKAPDAPAADEALGKAGDAKTRGLAGKTLPEQVDGLAAFAKRLPSGLLPLSAHNWLCVRLRTEAENVVANGKAAEAETHKLVAVYNAPPKRTQAQKPAPKKPVAKPVAKAAPAPAAKAVVATSFPDSLPATPLATAAAASPRAAPAAVETPTLPADGLREIAEELPALGQPPAMQKLFGALADLKTATDAATQARAGLKPGATLNLTQRRTLGKADATLERTLSAVKRLLASAT